METIPILTPEDLSGVKADRCYRGKILVQEGSEVYQALVKTHICFNEMVTAVMRQILRVLKDKENLEFAKLTRWAILNIKPAGQCASHFANPFTLDDSKARATHTAYKGAPEMEELYFFCKEKGNCWYKRSELFGELANSKGAAGFINEVNQAAIEKMSAWLTQLDQWHQGSYVPPPQMNRDAFIKDYANFIKKRKDLLLSDETGHFEPIRGLLEEKNSQKIRSQLREYHSYQLAYEQELSILSAAFQNYSDKALGKKSWLKQKQTFKAGHGPFLEQYKILLSTWLQQLNKDGKRAPDNTESLPKRWFRDPNLLQILEKKGEEGFFGHYSSPLAHLEAISEWEAYRDKNPDWPMCSDLPKVLALRAGIEFYIKYLKLLNPDLFSKTGFFGLLNLYRPFEGKPFQEFRKPPALRFPVINSNPAKNHPEWMTFSKNGNFKYRRLIVSATLEIQMTVNLIEPDFNTFKTYSLTVKMDKRLKALQSERAFLLPKGRWRKNIDGQPFFDADESSTGEPLYSSASFFPWVNANGEINLLSMLGCNLIFKNNFFYLHFHFTYQAKLNRAIKDVTAIDRGAQYRYKTGTRLLAVDMGQKADAVIAVMERTRKGLELVSFEPHHLKKSKRHAPAKPVKFHWVRLPGGGSFKAIRHSDKIRKARLSAVKRTESAWHFLKTGVVKSKAANRGQHFSSRLTHYINHCREQHYKQLAGVILKIAEKNNCHGIVYEDLSSYRMNIKQRRFENQRLQTWAVQKTLNFLETLCKGKSMLLFAKSAAYTSQTCSHCGSWGTRFTIPKLLRWRYLQTREPRYAAMGSKPIPLLQAGGDWFVCSKIDCLQKGTPNTRYILQADANAAKNLLIRAFRTDSWGGYLKDESERKRLKSEIEAWLLEVHGPRLMA